MNNTELIKVVSKSTKLDVDTVRVVLNSIIETVKGSLWKGLDVRIQNFANFTIKTRPEKKWRNPKTGEEVSLPKYYYVKVDISKLFRDKMRTKTVF